MHLSSAHPLKPLWLKLTPLFTNTVSFDKDLSFTNILSSSAWATSSIYKQIMNSWAQHPYTFNLSLTFNYILEWLLFQEIDSNFRNRVKIGLMSKIKNRATPQFLEGLGPINPILESKYQFKNKTTSKIPMIRWREKRIACTNCGIELLRVIFFECKLSY